MPKAAAKKPAKGKKAFDFSGLASIAHIDVVMEHLKAMREELVEAREPELLAPFWDEVNQDGVFETKSVPAIEGETVGTMTFKRKTASQPLKPAEIRLLTEAKVALPAPSDIKYEVKTSYFSDKAFLEKFVNVIEDAQANGVEFPDDFIEPATPKITIDDDTVLIALNRDFQSAVKLLPAIGAVGISKTGFTRGEDITASIAHVGQLIAARIEEEEEQMKAAA